MVRAGTERVSALPFQKAIGGHGVNLRIHILHMASPSNVHIPFFREWKRFVATECKRLFRSIPTAMAPHINFQYRSRSSIRWQPSGSAIRTQEASSTAVLFVACAAQLMVAWHRYSCVCRRIGPFYFGTLAI